ncbi:MAG: hypothetical protein BJ554DRAFT_6967 [Olpidium bornovanus]|uniref:Uncharacterized protein n=1 Tax=Olpidium bornovanus TaxID=278681 RepID=A0A8H8DJK5_9FUNG|nr:MAG: hypothetical protein BJ554DRAFT_6967 [Olpidium bornovanus]
MSPDAGKSSLTTYCRAVLKHAGNLVSLFVSCLRGIVLCAGRHLTTFYLFSSIACRNEDYHERCHWARSVRRPSSERAVEGRTSVQEKSPGKPRLKAIEVDFQL